jgi:sec-independent protein translocase protein TatB
MFDFAWSELGLIALVSVLVLGPKQLPETMRTMAKVMRRVRSLGAEFQGHVNEMIREAELEELRQKVQQFSQTSVTEQVTNMVDPAGEISNTLKIEEAAPTSDPHAEASVPQAPPSEPVQSAPVQAEPAAVAPPETTPPSEPSATAPPDQTKTAAP